ncbi:MAG TPA: polyphosphate kinase 1 [Nevskiaceae bacterium]|nr:polyphosphate kinase 1 [Nevskiaceae bacterium]
MDDVTPPLLYSNRYLSLLEFNHRVLEQARDARVPALERLRFLCISCSNLDEFFEIRVAGLRQMVRAGSRLPGVGSLPPAELLTAISRRAHTLVAAQYDMLNTVVLPALAAQGVRFLRRSTWSVAQNAWLDSYFRNELLPILSPIALDPAHPFPRVLNKSLNFIVSLAGKDAFGRNIAYAVVQAPRALPRVIRIPPSVADTGEYDFVFLSSIIHAHVQELFPGMDPTGCYQFRVTRDSDLLVDEEETEDLLEALEGELPQRQWGEAVRLEVAHNCPAQMARYLAAETALEATDVYLCQGPVNLMRMSAIPALINRPDLKYPPFVPRVPPALAGDLFAAIATRDHLLHHPYESFAPILELLHQAARDPQVLAIKQTLYRTGADSPVTAALEMAARAGKEVTVVVELRARFDEAYNISLAEKLQAAGAHVVYGVVGYKAHAKMLLIVRRENGHLQRYVHLATGNYHPQTARLYTDYGLLTAQPDICRDVHKVFLQLTSLGKFSDLSYLLQSPFTLVGGLRRRIEHETALARAGQPARIIAKLNALVDREVIRALYEASQAGVQIDLIVRGMCALRPGVAGVSDNIRVRSIVGRFLEHGRVILFGNGGQPEVWLSSADWMERNLFKRVEVAFPVLDATLRARLIRDLEGYLADTAQSWLLEPDGSYRPPDLTTTQMPVQQRLLAELAGNA